MSCVVFNPNWDWNRNCCVAQNDIYMLQFQGITGSHI